MYIWMCINDVLFMSMPEICIYMNLLEVFICMCVVGVYLDVD